MNSINKLLLLIFIISATTLPENIFAQRNSSNSYYIRFSDKTNSPFSVDKPLEFLSQRAIDRREMKNISITEQDFPVNPWYLDSLQSKGAKILFTTRWLNAATIKVDTYLIIKEIEKLPFVLNSEKVYKLRKDNTEIHSAESNLSATSNDYSFYGASFRQIEMLNGHKLHEKGVNAEGVVIAVIDAGFYDVDSMEAFKYLHEHNRILATHDFVTGDSSVYEDHSHGMMVLSAMGGRLWGKLVGTAPEASFILLRSENVYSEYMIEEDAWVAAAEFADSAGADIINTSLGYSVFDDSAMCHNYSDMDGNSTRISIAANIATTKGVFVVSSAGNEGASTWKYITSPADGNKVLAVGAVDEFEQIVPFSSRGPSSDGEVKPNVSAMGYRTAVASLHDGFVAFVNGTSLSGPVVTGLVACLIGAFPEKSNYEIKDIIEKSSHLYATPNDSFGYGIPDFEMAYAMLKLKENKNAEDLKLLELYPNPFLNDILITFYSKQDNEISISIFDNLGRFMYLKEIETNANSVEKINISGKYFTQNGIYHLQITDGKNIINKMILKM
ncbi:MAG: S8 family serine peptidase [Bacteroidota bacterium]|nr:S8 family serine peptidase [Bacteroidota bacterium]